MIVPPPWAGRLVALLGSLLLAVSTLPPLVAAPQFAAGVDLVEVYATVTGPDGAAILGLTAQDFTVEEDGVPQTVHAFAAGELPLAVAVALDRSFSMAGSRLTRTVAATRRFVEALRPADELALIAIGSQTEVLSSLSTDRRPALDALDALQPWGTTPLFDAVTQALEAIQPARGRRALVLLSDGAERYSSMTAADLLVVVRRRDVLVYPVALGRERPVVFAELAAATGGRSFHVRELRGLSRVLDAIASELRFQYLIGYSPTRRPTDPGVWRTIRVNVARPGARVRAREGYWG